MSHREGARKGASLISGEEFLAISLNSAGASVTQILALTQDDADLISERVALIYD